jgi:regulator of protease activity HflC (stomatin/prohibitin superfamily)
MATFSRYDNRFNEGGYRRSEEELNQLEKEFIENEKQKQKVMVKSVLGGVLAILLTIFLVSSCERIDAGHVGVKVNLYGDDKGVADVTEVTGIVFYNPLSSSIYEFPTFIQHKEYKKTDEGDDSFVVNSKDGSEFHVSPIINYSVKREKVPYIFGKYRRSLTEIENGFLKTNIYDAFRMTANAYTAEELISNRQLFETKVRATLDAGLIREGFVINQLTSNLVYPNTFKRAIEAKNNAVQQALMAENRVKTAEAQAKIKVATAEGNAQSLLIQAKATAEANSLKQRTLTPLLLQLEYINKWDGKLPVYGTVPQMFKNIN